MMMDMVKEVVGYTFFAIPVGLVGWLTVRYMRQHLREHWRLTLLMWLITLAIPLWHVHPRGSPAYWLLVAHLYYIYFFRMLPAVFTHAFIETLPESLFVFVYWAGALSIHVSLCSWLAQFLARRALTKRLFRRLI